MDPTKRLYENRNIIREKNLKENREIWKFIIDNIEEKDVITTAKNHETLVFKINSKKFHNQNIKDLNNIEKVLTSVASQIFKINSIEFNIDEIEEYVMKFSNYIIRDRPTYHSGNAWAL